MVPFEKFDFDDPRQSDIQLFLGVIFNLLLCNLSHIT